MEDPSNLSNKEASFQEKTLNSECNKNQEYLVMTVEIGDGRTDIITIHEEDDPSFLAQEFATKHNLDLSLQKSLSKLIRQNKDLVEKKNNIDGDIENWSDWPGSNQHSQNYGRYDAFTPKINEKSRKIMEKCERKGNVYERLYHTSKKNNDTKESIKTLDVTNKSKSTNNINYGEWLYVRGMKAKEAAKKNSEDKKLEILNKDQKELTFSPIINKVSSMMSPRYYEKPEEILYKKAEKTKQKIENLRKIAEEQELKECIFVPKINSNQRIRDNNKNIHEELFRQAEKNKEKKLMKQDKEFKQYSFAPNVELTKKKDEKNIEPVYERLLNSRKEFETNLEEIRKQQISDFDQITGQKLFQPFIGNNFPFREGPTWDQLYNMNNEMIKKKEAALKWENHVWRVSTTVTKTTENTEKIFKDFREKQYEKIFISLDSDRDGKISAENICIDELDTKILSILSPIFKDIQEHNREIDLNGFIQRVNILARRLNVEERAYLIRRENKNIEDSQERTPYINSNSSKLAEKKRGEIPDLYERLVSASQLTEMRLKKHKELQQMFELKDCTFKPDLSKN